MNLSEIPEDDNELYYKNEPYTPHTLHQRLIVTYSPKYARYINNKGNANKQTSLKPQYARYQKSV